VNRPEKPLNSQLNLLLIQGSKAAVPDDKELELVLALVELLMSAAEPSTAQPANGGGHEPKVDR